MIEKAPSSEAGLFGVEPGNSSSELVIIGVPWEPSASYGRGTSQTPEKIVPVSHQLDFFDLATGLDVSCRIQMQELCPEWQAMNQRCIALADPIHKGELDDEKGAQHLAEVNSAARLLNDQVEAQVTALLAEGKKVGILGGDHSVPLGAIRATFKKHPRAGLLHFDAHHDLRIAYEGFTWSHASIMYNFLNEVQPEGPLVSIGIRDFCEEEYQFGRQHPKVHTFYDRDMQRLLMQGQTWDAITARILDLLPEDVYVSFDIDGLDPALCPHTGTPVPGGLTYDQAVYVLETLISSGRKIIGFDLCEVAPDPQNPHSEWDLNVGARILYKLCTLAFA